jgi:transportin-1
MKLTANDISGMDSKYKEDTCANKHGTGKTQSNQSQSLSSSNSINSQTSTQAQSTTSGVMSMTNARSDEPLNSQNLEKSETTQEEEDIDIDEDSEGYNPNFTLRKCCSKILDRLSHIYSAKLYDIIKPILENDMQSQDWLVKERSILGLGACAVGLYPYLKACLSITLLPFLVRELSHPHKLVRAIALWTLSRFTKFILVDNLSENSYSLFKEYLCETLKKFLDKEVIVQEAACTAFSTMVMTKKEKLEPYLFDIFKIVANVFNQYNGTSLLTLYDIISLLTEYFPEHFKNVTLIEEVVNCVVKRWFDLIKTEDFKLVSPIFEMVGSIIKVSSEYTKQFFDFFLNGSLIIIENNYLQYVNNNKDTSYLDKESLSKSIDLISLLCNLYPTLVKENQNKHKILENFFKLLETGDSYLKHYLIAMIGDLVKADNQILKNKFDEILSVVFENLDFPVSNNVEMEQLSICNNACWTIGLMALSYPDQIRVNVTPILKKLLKTMSLPRVRYFEN